MDVAFDAELLEFLSGGGFVHSFTPDGLKIAASS